MRVEKPVHLYWVTAEQLHNAQPKFKTLRGASKTDFAFLCPPLPLCPPSRDAPAIHQLPAFGLLDRRNSGAGTNSL
jgi:hypothetical protein